MWNAWSPLRTLNEEFNLRLSSNLSTNFGCRFAASLIVLPQGQRYGRLEPRKVPSFLAALAAGNVYLPASRGNPRLDETAQAAELAGMRWGADHGKSRASTRLDERQETDEDRIVFGATAVVNRLSVTVATKVFSVDGDCDGIGVEPPDLEKRWLATHIDVL